MARNCIISEGKGHAGCLQNEKVDELENLGKVSEVEKHSQDHQNKVLSLAAHTRVLAG